MTKYYGQITMNYSTEELKDKQDLYRVINLLVDSWQRTQETNGISWDELDWTVQEQEND